jgi:hypothetical protein
LLGKPGADSPASVVSAARPHEQASAVPLTPLLVWNDFSNVVGARRE